MLRDFLHAQIQRKRLSNDTHPAFFEDMSEAIQSGMAILGYNLTDPLGIALDLRDKKVGSRYFVRALDKKLESSHA